MKFKTIGFIITVFLVLGSNKLRGAAPSDEMKNCSELTQFEWLLGDWQKKQGNTLITESWILTNENLMHARGVTHSNKKDSKPFIEHLSIQKIGDNIFYIAKPPQNELPVAFKLTQCTSQSIRFENITHDFPQIIEYQISSEGQLKAKVSSLTNTGFEIDFNKVATTELTNKQIVVEYVEAYNQKNLAKMLNYMSENIHWMNLSDSTISIETKNKQGLEVALKEHFSRTKKVKSSLSGIVEIGRFVSAVEKITSIKDNQEINVCSLSVYEFSLKPEAQQLIENVWYHPPVKCN